MSCIDLLVLSSDSLSTNYIDILLNEIKDLFFFTQ